MIFEPTLNILSASSDLDNGYPGYNYIITYYADSVVDIKLVVSPFLKWEL